LLKKGNNRMTGFFYNPNIHPIEEYEKRREALLAYSKSFGFDVIFGEYEPDIYFKAVWASTQAPERCAICWRLRLMKAAETAKEGGYAAFTTTLLVSPYQDREKIVKIGAECASKCGVEFMADDFRSGFRKAQEEARERGLYRQKYCGCVFSARERREKKCRA
jgi:predicted adenine nucleotide alpha hydrolase (AANH) superfamily ATPase